MPGGFSADMTTTNQPRIVTAARAAAMSSAAALAAHALKIRFVTQ
jgi:hypothetical protein